MPQIELKDLHKSFGEQKVLDGIDLKIESGETVSVLGRSGTGKSVLLKLLIGLLKNQKSLNEAGEFLQSQSGSWLAVIEASVGPKGDTNKDKELSVARAYAVRSYLVDHFKLDDSRLKIAGLGKSDNDASLQILVYAR